MPMRNRHSLAAIVAVAVLLLRTQARVSAFVLAPYQTASSPAATSSTIVGRFYLQRQGNSKSWAVKSTPTTTAAAGEAITSADEAKRNLKQALEKNFMRTRAEEVKTAVEILSGFNPTTEPGKAWHLLNGEWLAAGYDFPGTTATPEGLECTLGRLAFNIFEPLSLPIRIVKLDNSVRSPDLKASSDVEENEHSYDVIMRFCSRDGSELRGKVVIKGLWTADPKNPQRLLIRFYSGTIEPDDDQDLEAWRSIIGLSGFSNNRKEWGKPMFGAFRKMRKRAVNFILKLAFGFKPPASEPGSRGELTYEMTRSPKGWLDVIYLDEEMRVTRGNRGSIVVVTRM